MANGPSANLHWTALAARVAPVVPARSLQAPGKPDRHELLMALVRHETIVVPLEKGLMLVVSRHLATSPMTKGPSSAVQTGILISRSTPFVFAS